MCSRRWPSHINYRLFSYSRIFSVGLSPAQQQFFSVQSKKANLYLIVLSFPLLMRFSWLRQMPVGVSSLSSIANNREYNCSEPALFSLLLWLHADLLVLAERMNPWYKLLQRNHQWCSKEHHRDVILHSLASLLVRRWYVPIHRLRN